MLNAISSGTTSGVLVEYLRQTLIKVSAARNALECMYTHSRTDNRVREETIKRKYNICICIGATITAQEN